MESNKNITKWAIFADYLNEYSNNTSLHGVKYFGQSRSICERVIWTVLFVTNLSICVYFIFSIYNKYENSPIIFTLATTETHIYDVPFPAVTVCPEIKSDKRLFSYSDALEKLRNFSANNVEKKIAIYMSFLCDSLTDSDLEVLESFDEDFFDALDLIKPDFLNYTFNCKFMGLTIDCSEFLKPILTDEGVCYSFNLLDYTHIFNHDVFQYKDYFKTNTLNTWDSEEWYDLNMDLFTYPQRALFSGASHGLTINFAILKNDIDYKCKSLQGFKVTLDTPGRIPRLKEDYFRVGLDEDVTVSVVPEVVATSNDVKLYSMEKRFCLFPDERKLSYFKNYSQLNCQLECSINFTILSKGCSHPLMPRKNNTKICGNFLLRDMQRNDSLQKKMEFYEILDEQMITTPEDNKPKKHRGCKCLPLCTDLAYHVDLKSTTTWHWKENFPISNHSHIKITDKDKLHLSSLTVYFKTNHFIASERNELYGSKEFLANFGGLLGLFTGFSMLSILEVVYFFTLRLWCNYRLHGAWTASIPPTILKMPQH